MSRDCDDFDEGWSDYDEWEADARVKKAAADAQEADRRQRAEAVSNEMDFLIIACGLVLAAAMAFRFFVR